MLSPVEHGLGRRSRQGHVWVARCASMRVEAWRPMAWPLKARLQRQVPHLTRPLSVATAFRHQQDIRDRDAKRYTLADLEQSRHGQSCIDAGIGVGGHGGDIMRQQDAVLGGSPVRY